VLLKALMNGKFTPSDIDYLRIRFDIACIVNIKFRDMSEKRGHDTDIEDKIKISYVDGDDE
jgi:hypothetical protein